MLHSRDHLMVLPQANLVIRHSLAPSRHQDNRLIRDSLVSFISRVNLFNQSNLFTRANLFN